MTWKIIFPWLHEPRTCKTNFSYGYFKWNDVKPVYQMSCKPSYIVENCCPQMFISFVSIRAKNINNVMPKGIDTKNKFYDIFYL